MYDIGLQYSYCYTKRRDISGSKYLLFPTRQPRVSKGIAARNPPLSCALGCAPACTRTPIRQDAKKTRRFFLRVLFCSPRRWLLLPQPSKVDYTSTVDNGVQHFFLQALFSRPWRRLLSPQRSRLTARRMLTMVCDVSVASTTHH